MATTASTRRQFPSLLGLSAVAVSCGTTATGANSGKGQTKTLRYQGWAGPVTLPELAEDLGYLEDVKLKWVGNTISGPQDIQSAATGQIDFGGAFNGAVVKLASRHAPIKAVIGYYPGGLEDFVDHVVPILQQRGLFRTEYTGRTLREHYGLARPANRLSAAAAAEGVPA
ncbi:hypothetical protein [Streptomyces sp. 8N706]|uniref:hypothetical protein n=1 Tax=Streptomyces sp. 8N706 TaxID=3457416 RepID=UPI003FD14F2E